MLTRWREFDTAFAMFNELQRRMNQLVSGQELGGFAGYPQRQGGLWPALNLYDAGEELMVRAEVPGLTEKEVTITCNQDALTISGERQVKVPEGYKVHRQERGAVQFSRSMSLPCKVDLEKTTAQVKDGLLTVRLAKAPESKPRQIAVKVR